MLIDTGENSSQQAGNNNLQNQLLPPVKRHSGEFHELPSQLQIIDTSGKGRYEEPKEEQKSGIRRNHVVINDYATIESWISSNSSSHGRKLNNSQSDMVNKMTMEQLSAMIRLLLKERRFLIHHLESHMRRRMNIKK